MRGLRLLRIAAVPNGGTGITMIHRVTVVRVALRLRGRVVDSVRTGVGHRETRRPGHRERRDRERGHDEAAEALSVPPQRGKNAPASFHLRYPYRVTVGVPFRLDKLANLTLREHRPWTTVRSQPLDGRLAAVAIRAILQTLDAVTRLKRSGVTVSCDRILM
jgi:hypothetical protein